MEKRKNIYVNIAISLISFVLIFYLNLAKSGGDIAIVIMSILFCLIQLFFLLVYGLITKKINFKLMLIVVVLQIVELVFFFSFGNAINKYYKINFLNIEETSFYSTDTIVKFVMN
jgi:hypothetical protein